MIPLIQTLLFTAGWISLITAVNWVLIRRRGEDWQPFARLHRLLHQWWWIFLRWKICEHRGINVTMLIPGRQGKPQPFTAIGCECGRIFNADVARKRAAANREADAASEQGRVP